jgi:hypothetical protein
MKRIVPAAQPFELVHLESCCQVSADLTFLYSLRYARVVEVSRHRKRHSLLSCAIGLDGQQTCKNRSRHRLRTAGQFLYRLVSFLPFLVQNSFLFEQSLDLLVVVRGYIDSGFDDYCFHFVAPSVNG